MRRSVLAPGVGVALSLAAFAPPARAAEPDPKRVCIDADTQAQSARRAGKFAEARAALKVCVDARCPEIVRADCNQRMDDLSAAQPTVVIEAKDASGADLTDVAVYLDGQKVADSVAGEALPLDPGAHELRCEHAGSAPVTRRLVLREGERRRRETVTFGAPAGSVEPAPASVAAPAPAGEASSESSGHGRRTAAIAVGAGGVVLVAAGAVFGGLALSRWSDAKDACSEKSCPAGSRSGAMTDRTRALTYGDLSTAGFIAGGVLVAGAVTLYLTAPKGAGADGSAPQVSLSPSIGGGSLRVTF